MTAERMAELRALWLTPALAEVLDEVERLQGELAAADIARLQRENAALRAVYEAASTVLQMLAGRESPPGYLPEYRSWHEAGERLYQAHHTAAEVLAKEEKP